MSDPSTAGRYRFGPFEADAGEGVLRRDGREVALQELPFRLLVTLLEKAPSLVTRDELRASLWPPDTHLDVDASLNTAVARVRDALGDESANPSYVATVPRRGYKLVSTVERLSAVDGATASAATRPASRAGTWVVLLILAHISIVVLAGLALRQPKSEENYASNVEEPHGLAREHLLIGRLYADRRSREGLEKSIASYQSAIVLDPNNAEAYSGLAAAYALLGIYDYWRPRDAFGPASTMAKKAVELAPDSGEARLARGLVAAVSDWDWQLAARECELAIELAPESAEAFYWRGSLLSALGRHDDAITSTQQALKLDPTSPVIQTALGWRFFQARRFDKAIAQTQRAIELEPGYYDAWDNLKWIQLTTGNEDEAIQAWIRADEIERGAGEDVERGYRELGLEGLQRSSIENKLEHWQEGRYQSPYDIVLEYAAIGEIQQAMLWLERSLAERETDLIDLAVDPRLDALRDEARFQVILAEVGLVASGVL